MPYWFDGNNLIGRSAEQALRDRATRKAFLSLLSGHAASRGGRFLVYFDGDDRESGTPPRGVRVRFSAPLSCDDAILRDLESARTPAEIIVVTNDRGLGSRCSAAGAKAIPWPEFVLRMKKNPARRRGKVPPEEEVNLDEWSRFFGLDPESLR